MFVFSRYVSALTGAEALAAEAVVSIKYVGGWVMHEPKEVAFISPYDTVTVTQMNHIVEIQHLEKMNTKNHIRKLDKYHYVDLSTGEIKEYVMSVNRAQSENSLRQTVKKIRYLVNNNFEGNPNELHVILTYAENMTSVERLYKDFNKFIKRLKYEYREKAKIEYVNVIEPQARGAWHCHGLMRFDHLEKVYIENCTLGDMWGHGFVTVKSLKNVDNIGAYLSAYLTDLEFDTEEMSKEVLQDALADGKTLKDVVHEGKTKRMIKGGRLHMYPSGIRLYRKSKGIHYPDRIKMKYEKTREIVGNNTPNYQKTYEIQTKDFENTITFLQYNLKRGSK